MTALAPIELGSALGLALDVGGGTRFAFFPDTSGDGGGVFVDIEKRKTIPIADKRDPGARLFTFEISPDEEHLIAVGQETLVFRTDEPDDVQRLPREFAGATFAPDGQTMFSTRHRGGESAVVRVPAGGGDPEVLAGGWGRKRWSWGVFQAAQASSGVVSTSAGAHTRRRRCGGG